MPVDDHPAPNTPSIEGVLGAGWSNLLMDPIRGVQRLQELLAMGTDTRWGHKRPSSSGSVSPFTSHRAKSFNETSGKEKYRANRSLNPNVPK